MKIIDKQSTIPLYSQLMDILIEKIDNKELKENQKIPSERELCVLYDISRPTARKAIEELVKSGYIYKEHGKGSFVNHERYKQEFMGLYSFSEEMKKLGKKPTSKILDFRVQECGSKIASIFNCDPRKKVYVIIRLRMADSVPLMIEKNYLPFYRFSDLTKEKLEKNSMYFLFDNEYNVSVTHAEEIFQPVLIRNDEAELLDTVEGSVGMLIERIAKENSYVIEYTKSISISRKYKYIIKI